MYVTQNYVTDILKDVESTKTYYGLASPFENDPMYRLSWLFLLHKNPFFCEAEEIEKRIVRIVKILTIVRILTMLFSLNHKWKRFTSSPYWFCISVLNCCSFSLNNNVTEFICSEEIFSETVSSQDQFLIRNN